MGISASSASASVTYVSSNITCAQSCTLTSHFQGSILPTSGGACIGINGIGTLPSSSTGYSATLCNMFFPSGTKITAYGNDITMFGCLIG
jgi:hypothetical protein